VRESDLGLVLGFLAEYGAEVYTRDILLTPDDEKILSKEDE
jgi:hypothetical protein